MIQKLFLKFYRFLKINYSYFIPQINEQPMSRTFPFDIPNVSAKIKFIPYVVFHIHFNVAITNIGLSSSSKFFNKFNSFSLQVIFVTTAFFKPSISTLSIKSEGFISSIQYFPQVDLYLVINGIPPEISFTNSKSVCLFLKI